MKSTNRNVFERNENEWRTELKVIIIQDNSKNFPLLVVSVTIKITISI